MPALLVSVRDAEEVAAALDGGAALIDVKEPDAGSLGRASDTVREAILDAVGGRVPVSAALGELGDAGDARIDLSRLAYVKYGLAGCGRIDWRSRLEEVKGCIESTTCKLVVAAYADWRRAEAPSPEEVGQFALTHQASVLLLDTWGKDGSTLLDWLALADVAALCGTCQDAGLRVALAGSLNARLIRTLKPVRPDWFAVRGAACVRGQRGAAIDAGRVRELALLCEE